MVQPYAVGPDVRELPGALRAVRVLLFVGAGLSALILIGVLLVGPDAALLGRAFWSLWPGAVAFVVARRLPRGGRTRFVLTLVVSAFWLLGALGSLGNGSPRGAVQLLLPVAILVLVLRKESRAFFA